MASNMWLSDAALDDGLAALGDADTLFLCSANPTNYDDAATTYAMGSGNVTVGAPEAHAGGGRQVVVAEVTGSVSADGTPACWALVNSLSSPGELLAYGSLDAGSPGDIATGQSFTLATMTLVQAGTQEEVGGYQANAVVFNTSTWLESNSGISYGTSQPKRGTLSFWFYVNAASHPSQPLFKAANAGGNTVFNVNIFTSGRLGLNLYDSTLVTTVLGYLMPTDTVATSQAWHHFAASWDAATSSFQAYLDGANLNPPGDGGTLTQNNVDGGWSVGSRAWLPDNGAAGTEFWLADFYLNSEERVDLSTGLGNFISGGKPVDLGADGSTPTGNAPEIFMSGTTASWATNKGTAGGITVGGGSLSTASSSPSD